MVACYRGWIRDSEAGLSRNLSVLSHTIGSPKSFQVNRPLPTWPGAGFRLIATSPFRLI
jgi:hypothetical protein